MLSLKLRIILGFAISIYFVIVLLLLKRKALALKYTLLWLIAGLFMGILVLFPVLLRYIMGLFGVASEMNGLFTVALGFIISILMAITSIVSNQTRKIRHLAQDIALLEKRLRDCDNGTVKEQQNEKKEGIININNL